MTYEEEIFPEDLQKKLDSFEIIRKAFDAGQVGTLTYIHALESIEKAKKDISKLTKKKVFAVRDGKVFLTTVYVNLETGEKSEDPDANWLDVPVGTPEAMVGQYCKLKTNNDKIFQGEISYMHAFKKDGKPKAILKIIDHETGKSNEVSVERIKNFKLYDPIGASVQNPKDADKNGYTIIKQLGGSTGALLVEKDGVKYVKKTAADPLHLANEVRSIKYFSEMGVPVPEVKEYIKGEAVYLEFIEGQELKKVQETDFAKFQEACLQIVPHFASHAIMSNWDMAGMNLDNVMIKPDGSPVFIDVGGSMGYRAQGGAKEEWHNWQNNDPISEFKSMMDSSLNSSAAFVLRHGFAKAFGTSLAPSQIDMKQVGDYLLSSLEAIKTPMPKWYSSPTEYSSKLKQRLDSAIKQLSPQVELSPKEAKIKARENNHYNKNSYQQIRNLYSKEIEFAKKHGREDVVQFFDDFTEMMYMTEDDVKEMDEQWKDNFKSSQYTEYKKHTNLQNRHIAAIQKHSEGSSFMNNTFRDLTKGIQDTGFLSDKSGDGYNISFKNKEAKISFDFEAYKNFQDGSDYGKSKLLFTKSIIQAFAIAKQTVENPLSPYKKDITLYRGIATNDKTKQTLGKDGNNIFLDAGVSSNGISYDKSFNKSTKVIMTGAEGLYIEDITTISGEHEVIMKPFNIQQTTLFADTISEGKYDEDYNGRYQVRTEKPGLIPIKF